ncbi:MAG: tyrosine-type recombinase/integrase [Planctomycetia bacterium]|nr:tyrosine-type recombinase/integrase [Planctomycetia bacterium]
MAHLIRPWIVRYLNKAGRRVPKGTPGARVIRERSAKWYGQGIPGYPPKKRFPLATDKSVAQRMLADLVGKGERRAAGYEDRFEPHRKRPLLDHLEDYRRYLSSKGDTADHVKKTAARCRAVLDGIGAEGLGDLQPSAVTEFLADMRAQAPVRAELTQEKYTRKELVQLLGIHPDSVARMLKRAGLQGEGKGKARRYSRGVVAALQDEVCQGPGVATSNHYLVAVKGFSRWLHRDGRKPTDDLAVLARLNPETDVRVERRALLEPEFAALIAAAGQGQPFRGTTGADRVMIYLTAANTGLRASELASLSPDSFDFDRLTLTVEAAYSKRRRRDVLDLRADLAERLKPRVQAGKAGKPLWPGAWPDLGAEMIRLDLAAAGVPYLDERGRAYDFHALRHQFISNLAAAGVHPKMAQDLARHSDIRLTMNLYTHLGANDRRAALDKLPELPGEKPAERQKRKRG